MKRLVILLVAVLGFGATTFAGNNNSEAFSNSFIYKMNEAKTFDKIASFLQVGFEQKDALEYVFGEATKVMDKAAKNGASVDEATEKAVYFNLGNAKQILSRDQYIKFVGLINLTMINNKMN